MRRICTPARWKLNYGDCIRVIRAEVDLDSIWLCIHLTICKKHRNTFNRASGERINRSAAQILWHFIKGRVCQVEGVGVENSQVAWEQLEGDWSAERMRLQWLEDSLNAEWRDLLWTEWMTGRQAGRKKALCGGWRFHKVQTCADSSHIRTCIMKINLQQNVSLCE